MTRPALSICINTRNRAKLLSETLNCIIAQILPGIEIVVVDGASTDSTPTVMREYESRYEFVKYVRSEEPLGIDEGYDLAVIEARGDYCWLLPDDDFIVPHALQILLSKTNQGLDLIILNLECFTKDFSLDLKQRFFKVYEDREYSQKDFERFLSDLGYGLAYIGCVVIKRELWFEQERKRFFGTFFVHFGVILGSSLIKKILFLNDPLIKYRSANSSWTARSFEIWYFKWPKLVWSFDRISAEVKNKMAVQKPWLRALTLLKSRAMGEYSAKIYRDYLLPVEKSKKVRFYAYGIALLPTGLVSFLLILLCSLFKRKGLYTLYCLMISSPNPRWSQKLMRVFGLRFPIEQETK